ncbi:hypothetical protein FXO37_05440 [Capsicum annuum]|nr:hypothetical protein FXO37_05440 [Capsicum annuum]
MSHKRKESESGSTSNYTTTKATVQRDLEELPEQSQLVESEAEERYENNIQGGGQGSVDGDEENKSTKKKELEREKEDDHQYDDNRSPMRRELISTSQHDPVKTISIDKFQVAMLIDDPKELNGELVLKCQLGKIFNYFINIIKKENIDKLFKRSCFGSFLELSEGPPCPFPNKDGYGLLKHRIKYMGDDKDSKEGAKTWMKYGSTIVACRFVLACKSLP